ncbi:hypothetical protein SAMN04487771_104717 [[Clostridium] aminophilum]|uniref:Uncharacterized protein n=1 Tax=[Clostridium] aminophilum TaxID=1526 RepID=A0A1I0HDU3_9FIRM|nr:hypothetical protein SAMN04487771_104717 [[Clostridium] aminophilum]
MGGTEQRMSLAAVAKASCKHRFWLVGREKKGTPAKYECSGVVVSVWLIRFGIEVRSEIEIRSDRTQPLFRSVTMEIITMAARRYG